jgi:hypothetical protein
MTRRFVIGTDGLSTEKERQFTEFLKGHGAGYWHWVPNFWLVVDEEPSKLGAEMIRDKLSELEARRSLVMEIAEELDWATQARGLPPGKNLTDWLETQWADSKGGEPKE